MAEFHLRTPISEETIRKLSAGDLLHISGTVVTARDQGHRRALELAQKGQELPMDLDGLVVFHCGPIAKEIEGRWRIFGAGPTTSARMEIFEAEFIEKTGVKVIIGKGGMGERTTRAMKEHGAVYAAFPGGASVLATKAIREVKGAFWLDLGTPEAMWVFEVEHFGPLLVAIDSYGRNLHRDVYSEASGILEKIVKKIESLDTLG